MDFGRVAEAFSRARRLEGDARAALLAGLDPALRREVEELLSHHEADDAPELSPVLPRAAQEAWAAAAGLEPPRIESFRILRVLGVGGMGTVYEAEQDQPRRRVAIKVLRVPTEEGRWRFEREAQVLAGLQHSGIAQIYAQGRAETPHGSFPYLVMELVDGVGLLEHTRGLASRERIGFLLKICDAVAHAHENGVIHRDLKPGNILVTKAGEPKVLDFGLARFANTAARTKTGHVVGTLAYMSPEQALGDPSSVDTRSDVYALGVIAHEVIARRLPLPVEGLTTPAALRSLIETEPARLPGVGDLPVIVAKALEKEKDRRYATAAALAEDLRRYLNHEPILARPPTARYQFRKFVRRHRAFVGGVTAAILALSVGLVIALQFARRAARQESRARHTAALASLQAAAAAERTGDAAGLSSHLDAVPAEERGWEWKYLRGRTDSGIHAVESIHGASVSLGPDAKLSLLVDWQRRPFLLDTFTGRPLEIRAAAVSAWEYQTCFAGDTPYLFGRRDGRFVAVDARTGRSYAGPPRGKHLQLEDATASRDGTLLAWSFSPPSRVRLLALPEGTERWVAGGGRGEPRALAFSPDGARLAVGSSELTLSVLECGSGKRIAAHSAHTQETTAAAFHPSGTRFATASVDHTIEIHDAATGELRQRLVGHLAPVRCLAYSPDGRKLVSGSSDRTLRVWNSRTTSCEQVLFGHAAAVLAVGFSADGTRLVSVGVRAIRHWAIDDSPVLRHHEGIEKGNRNPYVYAVAFSRDGTRLASCGWDKTVRVFDAVTRRQLAVLRSKQALLTVAFSPDGRRLAAAGHDGIELWDARTGKRLPPIGDGGAYHRLVFTPDGRRLVGASGRGVHVFDLSTGTCSHEWPNRRSKHERLALSPDGSRIAHGGEGDRVVVRRLRDGAVLFRLRGHRRAVYDFAFSPDGRLLASAGADFGVRIWDVERGTERAHLEGHVGPVYSLAFTPDGTRLASGSEDATIRLWDAANGDERIVLRGHERYVFDLAFSPDGATLASASGDNSVRLWTTRPAAERARAAEEILRAEAACEKRMRERLERDPEAGVPDDLEGVARRAAANVLLRLGAERDAR